MKHTLTLIVISTVNVINFNPKCNNLPNRKYILFTTKARFPLFSQGDQI